MISANDISQKEANLFKHIPRLSDHLKPLSLRGLNLEVGAYSYGQPTVYFQGEPGRKLSIGNYVSIGPDVKIFCGRQGRHPLDLLSTYPMSMLHPSNGGNADGISKVFAGGLDVTVGNDVWIGTNVVIMAGVTIGDGAVVGAGAVVVRDIPPYGIALGVPAKVSSFRFSEEIIDSLLKTRWWDLPLEYLINNLRSLFLQGDMQKAVDFLESYRRSNPS